MITDKFLLQDGHRVVARLTQDFRHLDRQVLIRFELGHQSVPVVDR